MWSQTVFLWQPWQINRPHHETMKDQAFRFVMRASAVVNAYIITCLNFKMSSSEHHL